MEVKTFSLGKVSKLFSAFLHRLSLFVSLARTRFETDDDDGSVLLMELKEKKTSMINEHSEIKRRKTKKSIMIQEIIFIIFRRFLTLSFLNCSLRLVAQQ